MLRYDRTNHRVVFNGERYRPVLLLAWITLLVFIVYAAVHLDLEQLEPRQAPVPPVQAPNDRAFKLDTAMMNKVERVGNAKKVERAERAKERNVAEKKPVSGTRNEAGNKNKGAKRTNPTLPSKGGRFSVPRFFASCPDYVEYSKVPHGPFSSGPLALPFMRPDPGCRTFTSPAVERVIEELTTRMIDADLARLVENCLPNTLDTTVLWQGADEAFIVTGDIHAEWLRDAAHQLSVYQSIAPKDQELQALIRRAINTQVQYVLNAPYCNAFQPPAGSGIAPSKPSTDEVYPRVSWKRVFECKWELDLLASFLTLANEYFAHTLDLSFATTDWLDAVAMVLRVLKRQSVATYSESGLVNQFHYTFQRETKIGSETLPLAGVGNPVNHGTGLIRSAFRPSDDACILQFLIPANAQMVVALRKTAWVLTKVAQAPEAMVAECGVYADRIAKGIAEHGVVQHPVFGEVYAYEVDGYGGVIHMDDANVPSLLSLPDMGFVDVADPVYQNTRRMVLSARGNPYYRSGPAFEAVGGPHVGIHGAWPMAALMRIRTSTNDTEIMENLEMVKQTTAGLGLMHETVGLNAPGGAVYTRSWFAWCNSEFGKTILDLAKRKPELLFGAGASSYVP